MYAVELFESCKYNVNTVLKGWKMTILTIIADFYLQWSCDNKFWQLLHKRVLK